MTYRDLIRKYVGKYANPNPRVPNQCVDLVNVYCRDVLKVPMIPGNAINFDRNYDPRYFRYYRNTATFVPKAGDIAVFGLKVGIHGHTDIVYSDATHRPNVKIFYSFSQNWPLWSKCRVVAHNRYYGVKGFLRKR